MKPIRLIVVDDQHLVREGIASLLALQEGIEVVGTAENGQKGILLAEETQPDIILMDIRMPLMDGIAAARQLTERGTTAKILMLTTFDDEEYVVKSLTAGARGYLMKDIPIEDLARAVAMAHNGLYQMDREIMGSLIERLGDDKKEAAPIDPEHQILWDSLSDREQDILRYLARGDTNREIAEEVHLSEGTVKNYISSILTSLGLRDRTKAALLAQHYGWTVEG
ncbi:MAG: response regulator transcription factor [Spirochaetales bacterium]|nr:response regulator transcription factor [Spirochaetales bacterium]